MFTGIIKSLGKVQTIRKEGTNLHFTITSDISRDLKIDESISHNGVCLTVVSQEGDSHTVTAIQETLEKTNLGTWKVGDKINLEQAMAFGGRLDGHIVQGHVDITAICEKIEEKDGSWHFTFAYQATPELVLVDKGSICINGVSLTVVNPSDTQFSVAIIPYTYEHTNFHCLEVGEYVNLEFDVLGKYIAKYMSAYMNR